MDLLTLSNYGMVVGGKHVFFDGFRLSYCVDRLFRVLNMTCKSKVKVDETHRIY